jgi:hypothetical protein
LETFFDKPDYTHVKVIEGAYYYTKGAYRSEQNSCMIDNRRYYNSQSRYLIYERILKNAGEDFNIDIFIKNDKVKSENQTSRLNIIDWETKPLGEPIIEFKEIFR